MSRPMDAEPMTFGRFLNEVGKQIYVWRFANAKAPIPFGKGMNEDHPRVKGARTTMARAQRRIDDLVLARAAQITDERRCAAVAEIDNPKGPLILVRCEFQRGHGPVGPGQEDRSAAVVRVRTGWDHGNSKAGKWWMEPKESDA